MKEKTVIGFLGPRGSFSEEAAISFQKRLRLKAILNPYSSHDLITALEQGRIQKAILPIENSLDGQVNWVIDLLAGNFPFSISKDISSKLAIAKDISSKLAIAKDISSKLAIEHEIVLKIRQNLIGFGKISTIKEVYSHPSALGQCHKFLKSLGIKTKDVDSTSKAVQMVAEAKNLGLAAIGTKRAAEIYKVPVIKEGINDDLNNQTRFVVLGEEDKKRNKKNKTSFLFVIPDKTGALVRVLEIFDVLDINMKTLFSRPLKTRLGQYMFFVDIEGHQNDKKVSVALETLKGKTKYLKILGSYPVENF